MNKTRKQEIIDSVKQAADNWQNAIAPVFNKNDITTLAEIAAVNSSVHLIFTDTANNPYAYIGPDNICSYLYEQLQGKITHYENVFCWNGECSLVKMFELIYQFNRCLILKFQVKSEDLPEMIEAVRPWLTMNIPLTKSKQTSNAYISSREVCLHLKRKLSGRVFSAGNHWCWIGSADIGRVRIMAEMYKKKRL